MLDLLATIERLPAVGALKSSYYTYPLVNALHILSIGVTLTAVLIMDLRIIGLMTSVARKPLLRLMRDTIVTAFPVAILSGLALFSIRAQEYATNPAFQVKVVLLLLAGLNFWAFSQLPKPADDAMPYPAGARVLAALSMVLWLMILVAGRFIGFI